MNRLIHSLFHIVNPFVTKEPDFWRVVVKKGSTIENELFNSNFDGIQSTYIYQIMINRKNKGKELGKELKKEGNLFTLNLTGTNYEGCCIF